MTTLCHKIEVKHFALKLVFILTFSLTIPIISYADEVLIDIGDGPVSDEELGLSEHDLASAIDGSMIPEYRISDITETSANVVSEQYTVADISKAAETIQESIATGEGKETLLEVVDNVDDFAVFKKNNVTTASATQQNTVATILGNVSDKISENTLVKTVTNASDSSSSNKVASIIKTAGNIFNGNNVIEAVSKKINTTSIPIIATTASRQALIQYAKQFLGNPYVYGGLSLTDGADCSGFVQQIFKHFGITTGRTARDQYAKAQPIRFEQLQPGDLIFYGSTDYVNHVAIYAGDGVIIHAANARAGICTGRYDYRVPVGYGRFIQN